MRETDVGQMRLNAGLVRTRPASIHSFSYGLREAHNMRIWTSQDRDRARTVEVP